MNNSRSVFLTPDKSCVLVVQAKLVADASFSIYLFKPRVLAARRVRLTLERLV